MLSVLLTEFQQMRAEVVGQLTEQWNDMQQLRAEVKQIQQQQVELLNLFVKNLQEPWQSRVHYVKEKNQKDDGSQRSLERDQASVAAPVFSKKISPPTSRHSSRANTDSDVETVASAGESHFAAHQAGSVTMDFDFVLFISTHLVTTRPEPICQSSPRISENV
jgi:hypothetical protein